MGSTWLIFQTVHFFCMSKAVKTAEKHDNNDSKISIVLNNLIYFKSDYAIMETYFAGTPNYFMFWQLRKIKINRNSFWSQTISSYLIMEFSSFHSSCSNAVKRKNMWHVGSLPLCFCSVMDFVLVSVVSSFHKS